MRALDTDRQALDSQDQIIQTAAAQINTNRTPSVISSSVSMTSSARVIMAEVASVEEENRLLEAQSRIQTNPTTFQSETRSHHDASDILSIITTKSVSKIQPKKLPQAQNLRPAPPRHSRPPSPTSSVRSKRSTSSVSSTHARQRLAVAKAKNQDLKSKALPPFQKQHIKPTPSQIPVVPIPKTTAVRTDEVMMMKQELANEKAARRTAESMHTLAIPLTAGTGSSPH